MSCIKIVQGCLVVEHRDIIIGCVTKSEHSDMWSFHHVVGKGPPYNPEIVRDTTLAGAMKTALSYNPYPR